MADNKEYFVFEENKGNIKISSDVIASIAAASCAECEGVAAIANAPQGTDFYDLFLKKGVTRGVKVIMGENNTCAIEISLLVSFGASVTDVAAKVQRNVKSAVESMSGVSLSSVNVFITGVMMKK